MPSIREVAAAVVAFDVVGIVERRVGCRDQTEHQPCAEGEAPAIAVDLPDVQLEAGVAVFAALSRTALGAHGRAGQCQPAHADFGDAHGPRQGGKAARQARVDVVVAVRGRWRQIVGKAGGDAKQREQAEAQCDAVHGGPARGAGEWKAPRRQPTVECSSARTRAPPKSSSFIESGSSARRTSIEFFRLQVSAHDITLAASPSVGDPESQNREGRAREQGALCQNCRAQPRRPGRVAATHWQHAAVERLGYHASAGAFSSARRRRRGSPIAQRAQHVGVRAPRQQRENARLVAERAASSVTHGCGSCRS